MIQPYSKVRKTICVAGSVSFILIYILGASIIKNTDHYIKTKSKITTNVELVITTILLGLIIIFDVISVFSESFHDSMEDFELKNKFFPILEIIALVNSVTAFVFGAGILSFLYFFRSSRLAEEDKPTIFFIIIFALISAADFIMILLPKIEIARTNTYDNKSQMNFPFQNNNEKTVGFNLHDTDFFMNQSDYSQKLNNDIFERRQKAYKNDYEIFTAQENNSHNNSDFQAQGTHNKRNDN